MKNAIFLSALFFITCLQANSQTYTTYSKGSNNNAGGAYVAPVVTHTYGSNSVGYHPPERSSYSFSSNNTYSSSPYSSGKSGSSSGSGAPHKPLPKGMVFKDNGKYGIRQVGGNIIVDAIYDDAGDFSEVTEGILYFWVKKDGKYGAIYPYENKIVIPIKYDEIKKLNPVTALVKLNGKVGVVQVNAKEKPETIISPEYDEIGPVDNYCMWVRSGSKYGLVNTLGEIIIPVDYDEIFPFSLKGFLVKKDNKFGLINVRNEIVVPLVYDFITVPIDSVAWILKDKKWGLINDQCRIIATPRFDSVYVQPGGKVWVDSRAVVSKAGRLTYINKQGITMSKDADGNLVRNEDPYTLVLNTSPVVFRSPEYKYGYKNREGLTIVEPTNIFAWEFSEGMARVEPTEHNIGFLNESGKIVIPATYTGADDFGEGVAAVKKGEKWGFIDKTGKEVLPFIYDNAGSFHEGLCPVQIGKKYGYIDKQGTIIIPLKKIRWATDFSEGMAVNSDNGFYGFINHSGKLVVPLMYSDVQQFREGLAAVCNADHKWGFIDSTGAVVIPFDYVNTSVSPGNTKPYIFSEGLVFVRKGDEMMFINQDGNKVITLPRDLKGVTAFENGRSKITTATREYYIDHKGNVIR